MATFIRQQLDEGEKSIFKTYLSHWKETSRWSEQLLIGPPVSVSRRGWVCMCHDMLVFVEEGCFDY